MTPYGKGASVRRDGAANRERILRAAEEVFGQGGAAASTEEVARRAEVGIATVFRHFPTKQDLVEATAVRYLEELAAVAPEHAGEAEPDGAFAALVRSLVARQATKLALVSLLHTDGRGVTEVVAAASRGFHDAVRVVLERAQAGGRLRADATVEDVFVLVRALAHVSRTDPAAAAERVLRIALDGLTGRP